MKKTQDISSSESKTVSSSLKGYDSVLSGLVDLLESVRRTSSRTINAITRATYWEIGRRIVKFEQGGKKRAQYGDILLERLAVDLTAKFGRGFGVDNLQRMRAFYIEWPINMIYATLSRKSKISQTAPTNFSLSQVAVCFPLPWSHYVRLLSVKNQEAGRIARTVQVC